MASGTLTAAIQEEDPFIATSTLKLRSPAEAISLLGQNDENLKLLRHKLSARVVARGDELRLFGDAGEVAEAERAFSSLLASIRRGDAISPTELEHLSLERLSSDHAGLERVTGNGSAQTPPPEGAAERLPRRARPKTAGQRRYVSAIEHNEITFGIGPAGTGKTYLAVAMAVQALKDKRVKRIVLTRPAVEAGERLGFLPGDLQAKIDPYLRPLYDALYDMLDGDKGELLFQNGTIEVAPLAFMRGRTLNDAFIILDEAQNTTPEQMKMFLTRMGFNSRVVVTGDVTQTDLPQNVTSGLKVGQRILQDIEGISFINFSEADVVRHPLVARIVKAYDSIQEP